MPEQKVLVIGGGIAGLTASLVLARFGVGVDLVERESSLGGHAGQLSCKAADSCVKCGACLVEQTLVAAAGHSRIRIHTASRVENIHREARFSYTILRSQADPADPAAQQAAGADSALQGAADAVLLAAGFETFDPTDKPYGYGVFSNVITNLELERMLRRDGAVIRPSDGAEPGRLAFIQCVGSRDAKLGHLWCSTYCCGSALRAARVIKHRRPETEITVFFIDIQTFGRDFGAFFQEARKELRMVRAIPGDVFQTDAGGLRLAYTEDPTRQGREEVFDLVVLSVGMQPPGRLAAMASALEVSPATDGFIDSSVTLPAGVFAAGAVRGPMGIADAIADARRTVWQLLGFLRRDRGQSPVSTVERIALCDSFIAGKSR